MSDQDVTMVRMTKQEYMVLRTAGEPLFKKVVGRLNDARIHSSSERVRSAETLNELCVSLTLLKNHYRIQSQGVLAALSMVELGLNTLHLATPEEKVGVMTMIHENLAKAMVMVQKVVVDVD